MMELILVRESLGPEGESSMTGGLCWLSSQPRCPVRRRLVQLTAIQTLGLTPIATWSLLKEKTPLKIMKIFNSLKQSGSAYRCKERLLHTTMFPCSFFWVPAMSQRLSRRRDKIVHMADKVCFHETRILVIGGGKETKTSTKSTTLPIGYKWDANNTRWWDKGWLGECLRPLVKDGCMEEELKLGRERPHHVKIRRKEVAGKENS